MFHLLDIFNNFSYLCEMIPVTQKIQKQIEKIIEGTTFKYDQLAIDPQEYPAAAKAIERLILKGSIKRISTGIFYKPKKTAFGELMPSEEEILKPYLFANGKRIAYITGISLYNRMGLTTQIPKNIRIACRTRRIIISRGSVKATPVKSYVDVSDGNYYLLELLDALKDFKKIPDLDKGSVIKILLTNLNVLNKIEINLLIKCSLAYPPRVRSILGALLECINAPGLNKLKSSLNPLSKYDYEIGKKFLPTAENWNIN